MRGRGVTLIKIFAFLLLLTISVSAAVSCGKKGGDEKKTYSCGGVNITLPENFEVDDNNPPVAYESGKEKSAAAIRFLCCDVENISNYTEDGIERTYSGIIEDFTGIEGFEKRESGKERILQYSITMKLDETEITETHVIVFFEDHTVKITFTDQDGRLKEAFKESIKSITTE